MRIWWRRNRDGDTKAESAAHTSATSANVSAADFAMTLATRSNNGSSREVIAMMQATQSRHGHNFCVGWSCQRCCISTSRRLLAQPEMSAVLVVIADVLAHQVFQMALVEDDHMVEQIAAATTDESLRLIR